MSAVYRIALLLKSGALIEYELGAKAENVRLPDGTTLDKALEHIQDNIAKAELKDTPADADSLALVDSADDGKVKRLLWSRVKEVLKEWFDTLYAAIGHSHTAVQVGAIPSDQKGATNGVAPLVGGLVPLIHIPSQVKERRVVNTIAERDAISGKFSNLQVYVKDATADPTVKTGGADYLWDGAVWIKTGEAESMDVVLQWENILGRPNVVETIFAAGATAPQDKRLLWIDTGNGNILKFYNGSAWVAVKLGWA